MSTRRDEATAEAEAVALQKAGVAATDEELIALSRVCSACPDSGARVLVNRQGLVNEAVRLTKGKRVMVSADSRLGVTALWRSLAE